MSALEIRILDKIDRFFVSRKPDGPTAGEVNAAPGCLYRVVPCNMPFPARVNLIFFPATRSDFSLIC